jgi:hypothetical protein
MQRDEKHFMQWVKAYKKMISDDEKAFEWDELGCCIIHEALLNQSIFELKQKVVFKKYLRYMREIKKHQETLV